ncbi:hypothetical protein EJB05_46384, partial [Eragrostis curvula]
MKRFHGRDIDFEKALRGEPPFPGPKSGSCYTNDMLARGGGGDFVDWVSGLPDDFIYTNFCVDENDDGDPLDWAGSILVC